MISVLLSICLILSLITSGISFFIAWNAVKSNFKFQDRQKDYDRMNAMIMDILESDTEFMRTEIIRRLSIELPETKALNSSIIRFQNDLISLKKILKEQKMMEE